VSNATTAADVWKVQIVIKMKWNFLSSLLFTPDLSYTSLFVGFRLGLPALFFVWVREWQTEIDFSYLIGTISCVN
jgi:hypothetical protein